MTEQDRPLYPATLAVVQMLQEEFGDDDRVDWCIENHNYIIDRVDIYICMDTVVHYRLSGYQGATQAVQEVRDRITNSFCGSCEHCRAEEERDAIEAHKERALRNLDGEEKGKTVTDYIVPMAKVTCRKCGRYDLFQAGSSAKNECSCRGGELGKGWVNDAIRNGRKKEFVMRTLERVEVDFSEVASAHCDVWWCGANRDALINDNARRLYEEQTRDGEETCTENVEKDTRPPDVYRKSEKVDTSEPHRPPSDTDVAAVAKYDLERACQRYGCQLWTDVDHAFADASIVGKGARVVTYRGRALVVNTGNLAIMVRNGESIDDLVKAWVEGVR